MHITLNFSVDTEKDADIIAWAARQTNFSAAMRDAIRAWIKAESGVTLDDLLAEIRALRGRLVVASAETSAGVDSGEPGEAAANVDGLLDRLARWGRDDSTDLGEK